jgi:hypothetical protein
VKADGGAYRSPNVFRLVYHFRVYIHKQISYPPNSLGLTFVTDSNANFRWSCIVWYTGPHFGNSIACSARPHYQKIQF